MFNIVILEDEPLEAERLKSYINEISKEYGKEFHIVSYENGLDLLSHYNVDTDLVFLDINTPKIDGMTVAKEIRKNDQNVAIVFVTNLGNYAIEGYQVDAIDFILKPVKYYDFKIKMERILNRIYKNNDEKIVVKTKDGEVGLSVSKIKYVEIMGHYLTFHSLLGNFESYGTLKNLDPKVFDNKIFVKCSRSFIVNIRYIDAIKGDEIIIGSDKISISRQYHKSLLKLYANYLSGIK